MVQYVFVTVGGNTGVAYFHCVVVMISRQYLSCLNRRDNLYKHIDNNCYYTGTTTTTTSKRKNWKMTITTLMTMMIMVVNSIKIKTVYIKDASLVTTKSMVRKWTK